MRLTINETDLLKEKLASLSKEAKLYLFGSRIDDAKRGGDIDLRKLRVAFFKVFGEQKLDILLDDGTFKNPFHKIIVKKAVLL